MMKKYLNIIAAAASVLLAVSCNRYDIDEILLQRNDISMTMKGEVIFAFDPATCQLGHSVNADEYRAYDEKLAQWFILKCSQSPTTEGQEVAADLSWAGVNSTKSHKNLSFTVQKTDSNGLIWLWEDSQKIGIVIKDLNNQ